MDYTLEQKYEFIEKKVLSTKSKNPIEIIKDIMHDERISPNGIEHHFLDGASFLAAYHNTVNDFNLKNAVELLKTRSVKMPGAMCGYWGICGSSASIGASLAIIHEAGPLSNNDFYKDNMEYTSTIIKKMSEIGGPRCCKRNAFLALQEVIDFVKRKYNIQLESSDIKCEFSKFNQQCIKKRCPFYIGE